ncbi:MAG: hypothetical protein ABW133_15380 [Polyangiaceae bacterium]
MRSWHLFVLIAFPSMVACSDASDPPSKNGRGGNGGSTTGAGGTAAGGAGGSSTTGSGGSGGATGGSGGSGGSTGGSGGSTGGSGGSTGGSGGSTGGSGPSDGGAGRPADAGVKPDVVFDWPETVPGLKCKAGKYQGTFTGTYASSAAVIPLPVPVAGDINLTLVQTANGEVFEITNGKLSGTADLVFPFSADLIGKLNCKTSKLDPSTALKNGNYIIFGINFSFEGSFLGDYDKTIPAFVNGAWDVKEPNPIYGGTGVWTANWIGP